MLKADGHCGGTEREGLKRWLGHWKGFTPSWLRSELLLGWTSDCCSGLLGSEAVPCAVSPSTGHCPLPSWGQNCSRRQPRALTLAASRAMNPKKPVSFTDSPTSEVLLTATGGRLRQTSNLGPFWNHWIVTALLHQQDDGQGLPYVTHIFRTESHAVFRKCLWDREVRWMQIPRPRVSHMETEPLHVGLEVCFMENKLLG